MIVEGAGLIRPLVFGTRVLFMTGSWEQDKTFKVYDFSRWGCRALVRVEDGGVEKRVMPSTENIWSPKPPTNRLDDIQALGDSVVMFKVGEIA